MLTGHLYEVSICERSGLSMPINGDVVGMVVFLLGGLCKLATHDVTRREWFIHLACSSFPPPPKLLGTGTRTHEIADLLQTANSILAVRWAVYGLHEFTSLLRLVAYAPNICNSALSYLSKLDWHL